MAARGDVVHRATEIIDDGRFARQLAELIAHRTVSQEPSHRPDLYHYLSNVITPLLAEMAFHCQVFDNPVAGGGPLLVASHHESDDLPTVLTYGHGDVVPGMAGKWADDQDPFTLTDTGATWVGRGTADNKAQHLINLTTLREVFDARGGRLGFNLKVLMETSEELGSTGLHEFVAANADLLAADVFIASDGPRVAADTPTLYLGSRGALNFTLHVELRAEAHHSGHWGGIIADPATVMAHVIAAISTHDGNIKVPGWRPGKIDTEMSEALDGCPFDAGDTPDQPEEGWGEPGLKLWDRIALWPSFTVLALAHGDPNKPVNAIHPRTTAHCHIRFPASIDPETILPSLREHLDTNGFGDVRIEPHPSGYMGATCHSPTGEWTQRVAASVERSLGRPPQVLPSNGGSIPNNVFTDLLGLETIWIPHSYNGCRQHAPDEHVRIDVVREALTLMTGVWWDLGEEAPPAST